MQKTKQEKKQELSFQDFTAVGISIASPEQIKAWASDEVKKAETINYRNFRYERDGLFCERIFGPSKDYQCACGKYKLSKRLVKLKGGKCDRCGVELTKSSVRRTRMGYIELAAPVAHTWFLRKPPSKIGLALKLDLPTLERIIYYVDYIVLEDLKDKEGEIVTIETKEGKKQIKEGTVLSPTEYADLKKIFKDNLKAQTGAGAIRKLLEKIDLKKEIEEMRKEISETTSISKRNELAKRLKLFEGFLSSSTRPEWMILTVLPVIPPDLRPIVPLEGGKFASSDLNDLYRRIINRNNRLKELMSRKSQTPEQILNNERRMLQEAVDTLFEGMEKTPAAVGAGTKPLKSLSDIIKGKQGRFRQNLLGKRVDYSGRSVIVIGPELKLNECGLSKDMAIEIYKPFILQELLKENIPFTHALRMISKCVPQVYEIVEKISKRYPVLLNRAPTLHRMSIQAFYPKLIDEKVIKLHPLVCQAYNADFDGDQMAIHLPLTPEGIIESKALMASPLNILSPAHGNPIVHPTQDMILGCAYLTKEKKKEKGEGKIFSSMEEVIIAYELNEVATHARIKVKGINKLIEPHMENNDDLYNPETWKDYTTVGRVIFNNVLPPQLRFKNKEITKKEIINIVKECHKKCGIYRTFQLLDDLKELGFKYATTSGLTISLSDIVIPKNKKEIIEKVNEMVLEIEKQSREGLITESERYNKILDLWTQVTEKISDLMFEEMKKWDSREYSPQEPHFNSVYLMANSGARGNPEQVRQLGGMRGLMVKPQRKIRGAVGEIIETPVISNFKEGLSSLEYFISTHGGRKGLVDTALKTADAGYLTRKLIVAAHNVFITTEDCGTLKGVKVSELRSGDELIESLEERIIGRVALQNITSLTPNEKGEYEIFVKEGEVITEEAAEKIVSSGITELQIRSPLTCEADYGICAKCYGIDLSTDRLVEIGTPVGIIAAQSIGEPGTQLTLRTFHIGGTAAKLTYQSKIQATEKSQVEFHGAKLVKDRHGDNILLTKNAQLSLRSLVSGRREIYNLPYGAKVKVKNNQIVDENTIIAEWDPYGLPIVTEHSGIVKLHDLIEWKTLKLEKSKYTGLVERIVTHARGEKLIPRIELIDPKTKKSLKTYLLPVDTILLVNSGDKVEAGDILAKIPQEIIKIKDITGGLPRVTELFEARHPKNKAVISEIKGRVSLSTTPEGLPIVTITPEKGKPIEYVIPRGRHLIVYEGDEVTPGEPLTDGVVDPHDIAKIKKQLPEFLVNEIQRVYRLQGVTINDKHIEVIVRQMLSHVKITDPGSSSFIQDEIVPLSVFQKEKEKLEVERKKIAKEKSKQEAQKIKLPEAETVLLGISDVALSSESFIAAAAFQETVRVLTEAAVKGSTDELKGLKENIIVGKFIPVGTTHPMNLLQYKEQVVETKA